MGGKGGRGARGARGASGNQRDPLTGLRKCKPPLSSPLCREREDPFSGAQDANGAEIKCLRGTQVCAFH